VLTPYRNHKGETFVTTETMPLNIYQRINEVRKGCAYIQKDKKVEGGGTYMAVTHDAVTAELRPHLVLQGIVIVPRLVSAQVVDTGTMTKNQIPIIRYEALYEVDFVNMDEPTDRVTVPVSAHALDSGDKAPGKAASYGTKYAMLKLFSIDTGEAEEERMADVKIRQDKGKITPTAGAMERIAPDRKDYVERHASTIIDCFEANMADEAYKAYTEVEDTDEKVAVWSFLDSKMRRELKRIDGEKKPPAKPFAEQSSTAQPKH
jgi:hypothetical protein